MTSELKSDLSSFGYADGGYMSICSHCKTTFIGAKRSWSCEACAIKKSLEPNEARSVPEVPELVRYDLGYDKFEDEWSIVLLASGEYVRYDQAAEAIAYWKVSSEDLGKRENFWINKATQQAEELTSLKAELNHLKTAISIKGGTEHAPTQDAYDLACSAIEKHRTRAETAEAELDKIKQQKPFGYVEELMYQSDNGRVEMSVYDVGTFKTPLYAAPVASDAKTIERLREALKSLYQGYVNSLESGYDRIMFLGGQCDDVVTMEKNDPSLISARTALEESKP